MLAVTGATTTPPKSSTRHSPSGLSATATPFAYGPRHFGGASSYVDGVPRGWDQSADADGMFSEMFRLARVVYEGTACDLPGVGIKYDRFLPAMWAAVEAGYVQLQHALLVGDGLRWGFEAGLLPWLLGGQRQFRNYPSATGQYRAQVTAATEARVEAGRTLAFGPWRHGVAELMGQVFGSFHIFPMGAVPKPLQPDVARPTDDHTRTGVNDATDMTWLGHSLNSYEEIARHLLPGFSMHVSDVVDAYLLLPWAPWLWPHFFHRFYPSDPGELRRLHLYCHVNGDFGTRGLPGVFKIFFVDVLVNMARHAMVLTLPLVVYVDDLGQIGASGRAVSSEMVRFQDWAWVVCGVAFKRIKDKAAAQVQLMLGFWWDSFLRTRTLEETKLRAYVEMLFEFSSRTSLSLRERQRIAGRMQRAILTMPPGAGCLLGGLFGLMVGMTLAWQRRRTTRDERSNYKFFALLLRFNSGSGYFSHDRFREGETVCSDASKSKGFTGGGWWSSGGMYDWYRYGTSAARQPIDFLEGDTVVSCVERRGHMWADCWVPFGVDNQAFQKSALKGWSRAERLTLLLKRLFVLQIRFRCLLRFFWLSTHANVLADHLSRGRVQEFLDGVDTTEMERRLLDGVVLVAEVGAGRVRNLDLSCPFDEADLKLVTYCIASHVTSSQAAIRVATGHDGLRRLLRERMRVRGVRGA